jgi:uncharacterized protein involved in exopolysaccharide biosynthesis
MLHRPDNSANPNTMPADFRSPVESLVEGVAFIQRHFSIMLLTCVVTIGAAALYLIAAAPMFTATAKLVIDAKAAPADAASASTMVESQIALLKSEGLARAVIRKLNLSEDPEFGGQAGGVRSLFRPISRLIGWSKPETEFSVMRRALQPFDRKLSAKRVGLTYIVEITFNSTDPERAAQILNAVMETHIAAQMEAKFNSALRDEKWVKDRMNELSSQVSAAQKAVADYKSRSDAAHVAESVDAGKPSSQLTAKTQGDLRILEAAADSSAKAYDNFVRVLRYMEAQQQSSSTEAHVLIEASRPLEASSPKSGIVLAISTVGGLLFGVAIGLLRDLLHRGFLAGEVETTVWPVVVLQQSEAALANQNHAPAALSPLRRQNQREEPGTLAAHAGNRRSPDA